MTKSAAALLSSACLILSAPAAAQADSAMSPLPQSFLDCASSFRDGLKRPGETPAAPFDCTSAYFETLPGSDGNTAEMVAAFNQALDVADRYVDEMLAPEITARLAHRHDDGSPALSREFMLRNIIRAARLYGSALCELHFDIFSGGTIRSIVAGSCGVSNRDRLIDDLTRLRDQVSPD